MQIGHLLRTAPHWFASLLSVFWAARKGPIGRFYKGLSTGEAVPRGYRRLYVTTGVFQVSPLGNRGCSHRFQGRAC